MCGALIVTLKPVIEDDVSAIMTPYQRLALSEDLFNADVATEKYLFRVQCRTVIPISCGES